MCPSFALVFKKEVIIMPFPNYVASRGRILGRNPDNSLKSFPPCYSQSPLQLCLEISIFSDYVNPFTFFFKLTWYLTISTVMLPYNVKEKGGKPDIKSYPPSQCFKKSFQIPQIRELSIDVHEIGFQTRVKTHSRTDLQKVCYCRRPRDLPRC